MSKIKDTEPKGKGRPRVEFDLNRVQDFGRFRATFETMASLLECSIDTIRDRMLNNADFSNAYKKGEASRNMALSEAQFNKAIGGTVSCQKALNNGDVITYNAYYPPDSTMLIWLGKQYLGQTDSPQTEDSDEFKIIDNWAK